MIVLTFLLNFKRYQQLKIKIMKRAQKIKITVNNDI